jgi:hypothetical protein
MKVISVFISLSLLIILTQWQVGLAADNAPARGVINPITEAAVKAGMLTCAERVDQVAHFLTGGSKSGAYLFLPPSEANKRFFSASLELQVEGDPAPIYASMDFAPNQANGCGGLYETTTYWDLTPEVLITTKFASLRRAGTIRRNIIVLDAGSAKIFIMPAGKGSISIKKEVFQ